MRFSIVTASLRQLSWLKRCARSVADQTGVTVEHLVQDAGTGPELEAWARTQPTVQLAVAPDRGMYDAINTALARATGEVCGILNCDEQYLPGTLARVAKIFAENPQVDLVAGDYLVVDPAQRLLAYRKVTPLRSAMIRSDHLYAFTCALFFRHRLFAEGLHFDAALKDVADGEWVCRVLDRGHQAVLVREYLSTFTWTGDNRSIQALARAERLAALRRLPVWLRLAAPFLRQWRHLERLCAGGYHSGPISYEVFLGEDDEQRTRLTCERPRYQYPKA
jgi:glycosyltransferase involved in cell wall biosynthesis